MKPLLRGLALSAVLSCGACYGGPGTGSTSTGATLAAPRLPTGIAAPSSTGASRTFSGIYPAQGKEPCCWLAPKASFWVFAAPTAKTLTLHITLLNLAVYESHPQSIRVQIDGEKPSRAQMLVQGQNVVAIPIKGTKKPHLIHVTTIAGFGFVPKKEGINGDMRDLAMQMSDASAQ